jgi:hypothetical protein
MKLAATLLLLLTATAAGVDTNADWVRGTGTVKLDSDGWGSVHFPEHYLDTHFCTVADNLDGVTVGFSSKVFTLSDGQPGEDIPWACVPIKP